MLDPIKYRFVTRSNSRLFGSKSTTIVIQKVSMQWASPYMLYKVAVWRDCTQADLTDIILNVFCEESK